MSQSVHSNQAVDRGEPPTETYEARRMRDDARRLAADLRADRRHVSKPGDTYDPDVIETTTAAELLEAFAASLDERLKRPDLGHFEPRHVYYCGECAVELGYVDEEAEP